MFWDIALAVLSLLRLNWTHTTTTIVVAQAWCLPIFNLFPTQKTCSFTSGNKLSVGALLPATAAAFYEAVPEAKECTWPVKNQSP